MAEAPETLPSGVVLHSWDDFDAKRKNIFDTVKSTMASQFPQTQGGVRLELHDLDYADPEHVTKAQEKQALMGNKFLHRRLRGTYKLFDDKTGELLDQREATVMHVPYLTDRGTFVNGGSEYTTSSQSRLMSGVYTRRKASGELESHFNSKRGTGHSFRLRLEPESGLMKMDIGQSSLRLYSLLHDLGTPDEELEKRWGKDLLAKNKAAYDARVFEKAYSRLVRRPDPTHTREQKAQAIREALSATKLDRSVLERTLPNRFNEKLAAAWQANVAPAKKEFGKSDYLELAQFLNEKCHAAIPLDLPTDQLVNRITEALHQQMPGMDPEMLGMSLEQEKSAAEGNLGCLMAVLEPADAAPIIAWSQDNIEADKLTGEGIEHSPHVTCRFGFKTSLSISALKKFLKGYGAVQFTLGNIIRFAGAWDGKADCLVVKVESPDLVALRKKLDKEFDADLEAPTFKKFEPHLTLGYIEPGACKGLEGHARFSDQTYIIKKLVYSSPGSKKKTEINLED